MAAITVTPANVQLGSIGLQKRVQYGHAVTQGMTVYRNASDSKYYKADCNDTLATAACAGIVLTPGSTDDYGYISLPGTAVGQCLVNVGATLTVGQVYAVGQTAGSIVPYSDLTTNDYVTLVGVASTAALLDFQITISDTQKP